jgi:hypothetical protein
MYANKSLFQIPFYIILESQNWMVFSMTMGALLNNYD